MINEIYLIEDESDENTETKDIPELNNDLYIEEYNTNNSSDNDFMKSKTEDKNE